MSGAVAVCSTLATPIAFRKTQSYHPRFSSPEADIILRSTEGILFRVHSYVLRATSGLFQTIFSLPQPKASVPLKEERGGSTYEAGSSSTAVTIPIYEPTLLLSYILPLVTGKAPPQPLHSLSLPMLTRLLFLAEKWDTPGPISQIRSVINGSRAGGGVQLFSPNSPFCPFSPFSSFSSSSFIPPPMTFPSTQDKPEALTGEEAERAAASLLALKMDELKRQWEEIRKAFRELVDDPERFTAGNNCLRCGYAKLDNSPWDALKKTMMAEFGARPSGDTLLAALVVPPPECSSEKIDAVDNVVPLRCGRSDDELWPELVSCFRAKCPSTDCRAANYDPLATLKQIRLCVEALPWKISWEDDALV
ncbi:hypothetical protein F5887DRAFT_918204 [Amanita rubescens]|nr:hypothetical protein F5887DRAFT_918204 [Amanita rubescens]